MADNLFELNHYKVRKNTNQEAFGDGRYGNYDVFNENNDMVEITTSTFVQAVSVAVELFQGETMLNEKIDEMLAAENEPEQQEMLLN